MKSAWLVVCLAILVRPEAAYAHSSLPGIEGFYTGVLHPFSTPSQAILMLGLGLLVGSFPVPQVNWHFSAFLLLTLIGLLLGNRIEQLDASLFAAAFSVCVFSALQPGKMLLFTVPLVAAGGLLMGMASIPEAGPLRDRVITMTGSLVGANVGLLYLLGIVHFVKERYTWNWVGIGLRVAAAWLGAISLVMLALMMAVANAAL